MSKLIDPASKRPFSGIAGNFGVQRDESVRGVALPIGGSGRYVSLHRGVWRYWKGIERGARRMVSFSQAVNRLIPLPSREFLDQLNAQASGAVHDTSLFKRPEGTAYIYDLEDKALVERFALACALGEALAESEKVLSVRRTREGTHSEAALALQDALPSLNTNLSLWGLEAGSQGIVLFPDCVLLRRNRWQWVVPYEEMALEMRRKKQRDAGAPSDVARIDADGDGRVDEGVVAYGEIVLALSNQRVVLQVSNPVAAKRAADALARLIVLAREGRKQREKALKEAARRTTPRRKATRRQRTSLAQIVVRERGKDEPKITIRRKEEGGDLAPAPLGEKIVVRLKDDDASDPLPEGMTDEAPAAEPDEGLATPAPDPSGDLVFLDEAPALDEGGLTGRGAHVALLAYVAKGDRRFSEEEQRVIREVLDLPVGFHLEEEYARIEPESAELKASLEYAAGLPQAEREALLIECELVAQADGEAEGEAAHLAEVRAALGL